MNPLTFAATDTFLPADVPTMYFIGVTTGSSSIRRVFPRWAAELGLDARLVGIDLPPHAPAAHYRRVVEFIAADPLSLGALVTTHKIDLFTACRGQFDVIDSFAGLMGETSCLSKADGRLACHAKDPISCGLALESFIPGGPGGQVLILGAGGSAVAISWYLCHAAGSAPERIVVTDRQQTRLDHLRSIHESLGTTVPIEWVTVDEHSSNDRLIAALPPRSLVVNATGLGKDAPGSPLSDDARFPAQGSVWELNYRGDLVFLRQAERQRPARGLRIEDGWIYFLHGWIQVIAEVFHVDIPGGGPRFDRLAEIAAEIRSRP